MKIKFSHISINAKDAKTMCDFFVDVLNLKVGYRPPFAFDGYWLYDNTLNEPIVHIVSKDMQITKGNYVDHIAFESEDCDSFTARLESKNIKYTKKSIIQTNIIQVVFQAPEDIKIEVNFQ